MFKLFFKILLTFTFIFFNLFCQKVYADLGITSVTYDGASSFMVLNTADTEEYSLSDKPVLKKNINENKVYFILHDAVLKCAEQNFLVDSSNISEISVKQISSEPNAVKVEITYNDSFNPKNLRIKKIDNTIIVQFKYPAINNYYFQTIMQNSNGSILYEDPKTQIKVPKIEDNMWGQINSSLGLEQKTNSEFDLIEKKSVLKTKYYIDDISFIASMPLITGIGSYSISKPIYLSNPSRVAFDIPNSIVNPAIRNQEITFNQDETIRIGQFDKTISRIVITSSEPEKFIPVIYPDSQRLVFFDSKRVSPINLYSSTSDLSQVNYDSIDQYTHSAKLIFARPVIFGLDSSNTETNIILYNINSSPAGEILSQLLSTPFSDVKVSENGIGGYNVSFPGDNIDIHLGADGKTLRIKQKFNKPFIPQTEEKMATPEYVIPSLPEKIKGKRYVMIDPGHGGSDVGATRDKIYEKDIALDVSKRVEKLLKKKGYVVAMTRDTDETVSLQDRVEMSEVFNPDVFVSIHVNSSNSDVPNGLETHYYKDNSLILAKYVHASMLNNLNAKDRGLFKSKFYVINHTTAPAILVEMGFISNQAERAQIVSESRKNATAKAIAEGIDEYFKSY